MGGLLALLARRSLRKRNISPPVSGGEFAMKTRYGVPKGCLLIAATVVTQTGCKSADQRLRELSAAHSKQWDGANVRHNELRAACIGDAACIEAERNRHFAELTVLVEKHNAEVLALVRGVD
jgi:hypothetical protein